MSDTQIPTLNSLTADQVLACEVEGTALWFLKNTADGSEKSGPYTEENLREHIQGQTNFSPDFVANKVGTEEWMTVVEIPEFKRKPKLVSMAAMNVSSAFHLLENGQKVGPFSEAEIREKLQAKVIMFSDFISVDKGFNWLKIYELPQFDSRSPQAAEALPLSPSEETFKISKLQGLKSIQENQVTKDILAFVAFASKRKNETVADVQIEESVSWWSQHKKTVFASLTVFVIGGFSWNYFNAPRAPETAEAENFETMFANHPTIESRSPAANNRKSVRRAPAQAGLPNPMQISHHSEQAHNVPVPIEDAQINYDEPTPPEAPDPVEPPPPVDAAQAAPPVEEPQQIVEVEPPMEVEREPANDPAVAPPPPGPPAANEAEMFNQEAQ